MSKDDFITLIETLINGDISVEDHERLQKLLKKNPEARAVFRERMDLEASLRTWATEDLLPASEAESARRATRAASSHSQRGGARQRRSTIAVIVIAVAGIALLRVGPWLADPEQLATDDVPPGQNDLTQPAAEFVGIVRQQESCEWGAGLSLAAGQLQTGSLSLISGAAELSFDSGTDVVLEAPCELVVESSNSARLLAGNVVVNVTELSNGFTLYTPEAEILDLGTEYAVALDEVSTEVHVFDGSVIWKPDIDGTDVEDRIETGEARLYSRSDPTTPKRIPFGQRQFVRRIETDIKARAGAGLLAYDGFENLAGHLRRGRSGFGWTGGWQSGRRGRGQLAEVIETPADIVFGMDRTGRRQLKLRNGDSIQRVFEKPLTMNETDTYFISLLIERSNSDAAVEQSLKISLKPERTGRHRRRDVGISFGLSTAGFSFINTGNRVEQTASRIEDDEPYLCVAKLQITPDGAVLKSRLYHLGDSVSDTEPEVWTIGTQAVPVSFSTADLLRFEVGQNATWRIDELRIGTEWTSVMGQALQDELQ